jgi:hypothetical protein
LARTPRKAVWTEYYVFTGVDIRILMTGSSIVFKECILIDFEGGRMFFKRNSHYPVRLHGSAVQKTTT